jgi:hypothetical protein
LEATLTNASGNVIAGVTIASDIDYLAGTPVPEPSTASLLASTLITAAAARGMAHQRENSARASSVRSLRRSPPR